ncbi:MAG TPA: hypothetical protein VH440_07975, partial [Candidatus Limnocylindrales bacterium]
DAVVIVVSEENSQVSLVERARIVRNLSEPQLAKAIRSLLAPDRSRGRIGRRLSPRELGGRAHRLSDLSRFVGRSRSNGTSAAVAEDDAATAARAPR